MLASTASETIVCAFCHGKKVDPYNQLSAWSRCEVCHGLGTNTVPLPHEPCAYCNGTGSYKTFSCLVCKGKGVVACLGEPTIVCPNCEGRAFEWSSGLVCLKCGGRGKLAVGDGKEKRHEDVA